MTYDDIEIPDDVEIGPTTIGRAYQEHEIKVP